MKCDIIIPVWNQLEVTKDCVASIIKHTDYPYRLIIIDNSSDRPTEEYLKGLKDKNGLEIRLIRNEKNLGFVKAVNQGIKESTGPYLCIMNNDTIATEGWLKELIDIMDAYPDIGLLNPSSNTSGQFPPEGSSIDEYAASLKPLKGKTQELYTCRGFCMVARRSVIEKLGLLDEVYHIGYFDDTDYCKKAQSAGFRTARAKASYVYHKENISFKELKDNKALFEANETIFFKRWGKPLRVGWFADNVKSGNRIDDIATSVARNGHQILIFVKRGVEWPVKLDHFDIRRYDLNPYLFGIFAIYKILKRRKKKKLDVLITDNVIFGNFLKAITLLHSSDVMIMPDVSSLLELLEKRSRYP